jgi:hypothetical protein
VTAAVLALSLAGFHADAAFTLSKPQDAPPPATQAAPAHPAVPYQVALPPQQAASKNAAMSAQQMLTPTQAAPAEDILDIRGPIHIPAQFPWLAWSAGAIGAVALGYGAWAFFRRPRRKLPYEIALEKLEATRPLMKSGEAQPFSLAVSEIVRLFIEECLPVRAAHRTTTEFLRDLVEQPDSPLAAHRDELAGFLYHCDLAKFARWALTVREMEAMLSSASVFVIAIGKPKSAEKQISTHAPAPAAEPEDINS